MGKLKYVTGCTILILLVLVPLTMGQTSKGFIVGTVADPNGAAVAGATIKVTNSATGTTRETNSQADGTLSLRRRRSRYLQDRSHRPGI